MDHCKLALVSEFLDRKHAAEWLGKEINHCQPIPQLLHPQLKKTVLICRLYAQLYAGGVSADTLQLLEALAELDRHLGAAAAAAAPSPAMRSAYCAVAAKLTVVPCRQAHSSGSLLQRDTRRDALEAVKEYVRVAMDEMGPSLLQLVARAAGVEEDDAGGTDEADQRCGEEVGAASLGVSATAEADRSRGENVGASSPSVVSATAEADRSYGEEVAAGVFATAEADRSRGEEVGASNPSRVSTTAEADRNRGEEVGAAGPSGVSATHEDQDVCRSSELVKPPRRARSTTKNQRRPSLMLPGVPKKITRKRKIKRWTPREEDALREAVKKHGRGNWTLILRCYAERFKDRTAIDLKDKWRNMTK